MGAPILFQNPFRPAERLRRMAAQGLLDAETFERSGNGEAAAALRLNAAEWSLEAVLFERFERRSEDLWKGASAILERAKRQQAAERRARGGRRA